MRVRAGMIVAVALASASCVFAQFPGDGGGPGGPGGGGPGGGRGGDMRGPGGMMGGDGVEQAKAALKATDEEWQVLRPAIQKVVNARRASDAGLVSGQPRGMFGGRGGRGGGGGPGGGMGNDSFNGPNNSGPGGRGGMGNRGGPPAGDGAPPPPDAGNNAGSQPSAGGAGGQGGPGGQNQQQGGNRQNNTGGPNGGGPNGGGPNAGGPNAGGPPGMAGAPAGPVGNAMNDLKTVAGQEGVKAEELNAKIAAVRAERKKAREGLAMAVDELKALVTPEQEAMLIALGFLE